MSGVGPGPEEIPPGAGSGSKREGNRLIDPAVDAAGSTRSN